MSTEQQRATIVDVAKRAGVSVGTVSRVLNHATGPSETRRKVLDAVDALGYVPNHVARSLKRRSTEQIAFVVPDIANPVYVAMAKAVQGVARDRGYRLSLISTADTRGEEEFALASLEQRRVDGVILCSLKPTSRLLHLLERAHERVCVIGRVPDEAPIDNVRVDSAAGAAMAVQHLLDAGRQAVGFINGDPDTVPATFRRQGFDRAMAHNNLEADADLAIDAEFTMTGGYGAVDALLARKPDLDALFCANDVIALGALRRLAERGIEVPGRIAVVGMDDIELSRISTPTLSSVSLLADRRGAIAADLLFQRLTRDGDEEEAQKITVTPRLLPRESSTDYVRQDRP